MLLRLTFFLLFSAATMAAEPKFEAGPPPFKLPEGQPKKFEPTTVLKDGKWTLRNRGNIRGELGEGTLSFDWTPVEGIEKYEDILCVGLSADGKLKAKPSFELEKGYLVRFNPSNKKVAVEYFPAKDVPLTVVSRPGYSFPNGKTVKISIRREASDLTVTVNGEEAFTVNLLQEKLPKDVKVIIYTREPTGSAHESWIERLNFEPNK